MITVFNTKNNNNLLGRYPLFLAEDLGFMDTINVSYPQLEELYQLQIAQLWNEKEYFLDQDRRDMLEVDKDSRDIMIKTIMWQWLADSIVSRSIIETLGPFISNSEMLNLATVWGMFEVIHGRAYAHIVRQAFEDPQKLMEEAKEDHGVFARSEIITKTFDRMLSIAAAPENYTQEEKQHGIILTIAALLALEAIGFIASFACTFALTETGKFAGIGNIVKAVCKDEILHTRMNVDILQILRQEWPEAYEESKNEMKKLFDEVIQQERAWSRYIFSQGRKILGLNEKLLVDYVLYLAGPLYEILEIRLDFDYSRENPLPYMDKYIDPASQQTAAQELELTSYRVAAVQNDLGDDTLVF